MECLFGELLLLCDNLVLLSVFNVVSGILLGLVEFGIYLVVLEVVLFIYLMLGIGVVWLDVWCVMY